MGVVESVQRHYSSVVSAVTSVRQNAPARCSVTGIGPLIELWQQRCMRRGKAARWLGGTSVRCLGRPHYQRVKVVRVGGCREDAVPT